MLVGAGPTTGLIVSSDGYLVSSAFNFIQKPTSILVTLHNGDRLPAEIVSRDNSRMLVLLKVRPTEPLTVPAAAVENSMQVGQWVIAIGRTFDVEVPNLSVGILSAKRRIWGKAIQTDAKISPSNYGGPLIDLRGNVLGVLVPLSPDSQSELAGAQWYDSGIGFAVPLNGVYDRLERWQEGSLDRGILGITLKGREIYATAATIAGCQVRSPAYLAGIRAGDVIVRCDGHSIDRQAQLKHLLGPLYAGETVALTVARAGRELDFEVELVDQLIPYDQPFLGVLPARAPTQTGGVRIRFVYPGSGADEAGIVAGDSLVAIGDKTFDSPEELRAAIANEEPTNAIAITIRRGAATNVVNVTLSRLPDKVPASLPTNSATNSVADSPADNAKETGEEETGEIAIEIPEEANDCFAYIPTTYDPTRSYSLLTYLTAPGALDREKLLNTWQPLCEQHDLILVVPEPADSARWQPTEVDFIRKVMDRVSGRYQIDPQRTAVMGRAAGGSMAYFVAFRLREVVRGLVAVDAAMPGRLQPPDAEPTRSLSFLVTTAAKSRVAERIQQGIARLRGMKHPVTVQDMGDQPRKLTAKELEEVARWIDSLDRI
jgi:serine protease Do